MWVLERTDWLSPLRYMIGETRGITQHGHGEVCRPVGAGVVVRYRRYSCGAAEATRSSPTPLKVQNAERILVISGIIFVKSSTSG